MSELKKPSQFPTLTAAAGVQGLVMKDGSFAKCQLTHLLAMMLMPFAQVGVAAAASYTRSQWMEYARNYTYWYQTALKAGDVLVIQAMTSDTNQRVVYYFRITSVDTNMNVSRGYCFLMLMEGEPPIWPDKPT